MKTIDLISPIDGSIYLSRDVLPTGTYPVRIEHPGYDSVEMFVTLEPGRVTPVDTLLFPKLR